MLCFSMKAGEYFTVGGETVIQYNRLNGDRVHLMIHAPREVAIVRGDVLERGGGQRPECVANTAPRFVKQLPWNHAKKQALKEMRDTLEQMGDTPEAKVLKEKLALIFPVRLER